MITALEQIARDTAARHGLPPEIICGLIERESNWDPWAVRYEPGFLARYVMPQYAAGKLDVTETYMRSMSFGLGQIMGQTARELGFEGKFLTELFDPPTNVEFICRKLDACLEATRGEIAQALERYNGGNNLAYSGEVIALAAKYTKPPMVQSA